MTATDINLTSGAAAFSWTTEAEVPDVLGMTQAQAVAEVGAAGLTVGPVSKDNHCLGPAGTVVGQSHPARQILPAGTEIRLNVSTGLNNKGKPCIVQ